MPFIHSMPELSHICLHSANGSINPFHQVVCLVRGTLHDLPSILQPLSPQLVHREASHSTSFPEQRIPSTSVSQSHKTHAAKGSLCICRNSWPKLTKYALVYGHYVITQSHWGPLADTPRPPSHRLLMLHFLLHNRWLISDTLRPHNTHHQLLIPHNLRLHVPQGNAALAPTCMSVALAPLQSLQFMHLCSITDSTIHICLQGSQQNPPMLPAAVCTTLSSN